MTPYARHTWAAWFFLPTLGYVEYEDQPADAFVPQVVQVMSSSSKSLAARWNEALTEAPR